MAAGLQVWNAKGKLIFDTTINTTFYLGSGNTGTNTNGGSLTDSQINNRNVWIIITDRGTDFTNGILSFNSPIFDVRGNTISWSYYSWGGYTKVVDSQFIYGVY